MAAHRHRQDDRLTRFAPELLDIGHAKEAQIFSEGTALEKSLPQRFESVEQILLAGNPDDLIA